MQAVENESWPSCRHKNDSSGPENTLAVEKQQKCTSIKVTPNIIKSYQNYPIKVTPDISKSETNEVQKDADDIFLPV